MRMWVTGNSGAGKSTLSRAVSERTSAPWIQLDALFHQPNWTPRPAAELRSELSPLLDGSSWVVDGNYNGTVGDLVLARADTVVLLDPPRHVVMRQVIGRTARRLATREELWNGNRESLRRALYPDRERSIIVWAWTTYGQQRARFAAAEAACPPGADLRFVHLRGRRDAAEFLRSLPHR